MKNVTLSPRRGRSIRTQIEAGGDITIPRPRPAADFMVRCKSCVHRYRHELHMGLYRSSCEMGRFPPGVTRPRQYSDHELDNPTIELAAIARACPDFASVAGDAA